MTIKLCEYEGCEIEIKTKKATMCKKHAVRNEAKEFMSNQGEIFIGTKAELCRVKGIKHKNGFRRPSGAKDKNGDRWLLRKDAEACKFRKENLYLFDRKKFEHVTVPVKNAYGEIVGWKKETKQYYEPMSGTASIYLLFKDDLLRPRDKPFDYDLIQTYVDEVERKYELIGCPEDANDIDWLRKERKRLEKERPDGWKATRKNMGYHLHELEREHYKKCRDGATLAKLRDTDGDGYRAKMKRAAAVGKLNEFKAGTYDPDGDTWV